MFVLPSWSIITRGHLQLRACWLTRPSSLASLFLNLSLQIGSPTTENKKEALLRQTGLLYATIASRFSRLLHPPSRIIPATQPLSCKPHRSGRMWQARWVKWLDASCTYKRPTHSGTFSSNPPFLQVSRFCRQIVSWSVSPPLFAWYWLSYHWKEARFYLILNAWNIRGEWGCNGLIQHEATLGPLFSGMDLTTWEFCDALKDDPWHSVQRRSPSQGLSNHRKLLSCYSWTWVRM